MTRRWIEAADVRCVTIHADERAILIDRIQLGAEILSQAGFVVTLSTRRYRYIRLQATQRRSFRDVDMTRRALRDVLFFLAAAVVNELRGDSRGIGQDIRRIRQLVTAVAVRSDRFLGFPVTVETR